MAVLSVLPFDVKRVEEKKLTPDGYQVWVTAVVVAYLEGKMKEGKDTWTLAVRKAKNWMKKEGGGVAVETWLEAAEKFVQETK